MSTPSDSILSLLNSLDNSDKLTADFEQSLLVLALRIRGKGLKDSDVTNYVIPFLKANPTITELDISDNLLTSVSGTSLAAVASLRIINISNNPIGDDGATALATSPNLYALGCIRCQIRDAGTEALAANPSLMVLNIAWNATGDQGAFALIGNETMQGLSISLDGLSDITIDSLRAKQSSTFALDDSNSTNQIKVESADGAVADGGVI